MISFELAEVILVHVITEIEESCLMFDLWVARIPKVVQLLSHDFFDVIKLCRRVPLDMLIELTCGALQLVYD